jgi:hypothetical protein
MDKKILMIILRDLCINRNNHQKPTFHPLGNFLNPGKRGYRHKQANRLADERHQKKNKAIKLTDSVKNYIETFA